MYSSRSGPAIYCDLFFCLRFSVYYASGIRKLSAASSVERWLP